MQYIIPPLEDDTLLDKQVYKSQDLLTGTFERLNNLIPFKINNS